MPAPRPLQAGLVALLTLAAACSTDSDSPAGPATGPGATSELPTSLEELVPVRRDFGGLIADRAHWADGYVWASSSTSASYTPPSTWSFNRLGNPITITKPAGTTGRYLVKFAGLSGFLGSKSTVQVTGYTVDDTYCKPAGPALVNNQVEVRCFKASTGAAINATFSALVTRNYGDLAFAHASQPTAASYTPPAAQSWNPAGAITVTRSAPGTYVVTFTGLAALTGANGGHVQVSPVGTTNAHCKVGSWLGVTDLAVNVRCFSSTGAAVDSKFNVLFLLPTPHLAYVWANQPSAPSYSPSTAYLFNPSGGPVSITRTGVGAYAVTWTGADVQIFDGGNVQVSAYGTAVTECKVSNWTTDTANIRCFGPTGIPTDSYFTVLMGS